MSAKYRHVLALSGLLLASLVGSPVFATVTQVDGTIVPTLRGSGCVDGNLQACLDDEEGVSAPDPNAIDAIIDARQVPELFLPDPASPVAFADIAEGAGFENSFGYYNIGDDVTDTANLHPILGCGVPASTHTGEAGGYVQNAEPGTTTTVDFAVEAAAGRYRGGFIGFYLITPEPRPDGTTNCGDFAGSSYFGRIYFTQRELNNDGDFVHHLVYQSRLVEDRFYFGFEDLFRGGDNDFEDMAVKVTGLTPPCVPRVETCNGLDDDCDGLVDAADDSLADAGGSCVCDGASLPCEGGARDGVCQQGATACVAGALLCRSQVEPSDELCNLTDDNCDGSVDNGTVDTGSACDGPDADLCLEGVTTCSAGVIVCGDTSGPNIETCNGADDDCDTLTDEEVAGVDVPCDGPDGDQCLEGVTRCTGGALVCDDATDTLTEQCNGVDDDCDGSLDESPGDVGAACTVGAGACARTGATVCSAGTITCNVSPGTPSSERCNTLDDDCDGSFDEDFMLGQVCVAPGACGPGLIECAGEFGTICSSAPGGSMDGSVAETCNDVDDDCDTRTDEGLNDIGPCGTSVGECSEGRERCVGGSVLCVGGVGPAPELCNGADDNCNGMADDDPVDTGSLCGSDVGECSTGVEVCDTATGALVCAGATGPSTETCNGLDDDCDTRVDEGLNDLGPCGTSVGECSEGRDRCLGGAIVCSGGVGPLPELCNGADDDCDGEIDDDPVDEGAACGTDTGECVAGVETCDLDTGMLVCVGATGPTDETCNGLDDDCDGVVDESPTDIGLPCGTSDVGECRLGETICVDANPVCAGAIEPNVELCNGLDDDCDGDLDDDPIDVGRTCGSALGSCEPGSIVCIEGAPVCEGATEGSPEVCNGTDDDCDSIVDEDPSDAGGVCGISTGVCEEGALRCISGGLECVGGVRPGTEVCNGLDDDCNGVIDDGELCEGGVCIGGRCSVECVVSEFGLSCPRGQTCVDGFCLEDACFGVVCEPDEDGGRTVCEEGVCVPICSTLSCDAPNICRASDGACVPNDCRELPDLCATDERCDEGTCVDDPCAGVECQEREFCRDGSCVGTCVDVDCGPMEQCRGGNCEPTGCDVPCPPPRACVDGACIPSPCESVACLEGEWCDPAAGGCVSDPCRFIECPSEGDRCEGGECVGSTEPPMLDGGIFDAGRPEEVVVAGGGHCSAAPAGGTSPWLLCLALIGLIALRRRRRLILALAGLVWLGLATGCEVDPYCLANCGDELDGGSEPVRDAGGAIADAGADNDACVPTGEDEECNERDDDCDTLVDEDFDLTSDARHCGACDNRCELDGAQTSCEASVCRFERCFDGFRDLDGDTDGDFGESNGCEYGCFESNAGEEACDEIDNDCDGLVDEDFDLDADGSNCGRCGRLCAFFRVDRATCASGECIFDPADCTAGFLDINGDPSDGCELECTPAADPTEQCNGLDDDCDGRTDEDFDLDADPSNCGRCDRVCSFTSATARCSSGTCGFDPALDCLPGFSDRDGVQLNGCEFECTPTADPAELCDGIDNDCDGRVDGATTDAGGSCNLAPGGVATGACEETGVLTCVGGDLACLGAPQPTVESCNDIDDDCDGTVDEEPLDEGRVCEDPRGLCTAGFTVCRSGGALACERAVGPSDEVCNALDDDCDGVVDEELIDPGVGEACGVDTGECSAGALTCVEGVLRCVGEVTGAAEVCNDADDDCDGVVDEDPAGEGQVCEPPVGLCTAGFTVCQPGGMMVCERAVGPSDEVCNGLDDDCDGEVDEEPTDAGIGDVCGTDVGECSAGLLTCVDGGLRCVGEIEAQLEVCNGLDDDCDGVPDDTPVDVGGACGSSTGVCLFGSEVCVDGRVECAGGLGPSSETCDGRDEDCDGAVDELVASRACYTGSAETRGVGECADGVEVCADGSFGACGGQTLPVVETCNNRDDDCDGPTDEGLTEACYGGPDGTEGVGRCRAGVRTCSAGIFGACTGDVVPAASETCDGQDDDCDGVTDEAADGGVLTQSCYTGRPGSAGIGTCVSGTQTCVSGAFGAVCEGEVIDTVDRCGDGLDTDCDDLDDAAEGCFSPTGDVRLDIGDALGANHSFDVVSASGGDPLGRNVYVAWSEKRNGAGTTDIFLVRSTDGGSTWSAPVDLTTDTADAAVQPRIAVGRNGGNDIVHIVYQVVPSTGDAATRVRRLYARSSTNSASTFSAPLRLDTTGGTDNFKHDLATSSDGARVVVAWEQLGTATLDRYILSRASDNSGAGWAGERLVNVNVGASPTAGEPAVAVTSTGRFVYAWREARPPSRSTFDIYANWSDGVSSALSGATEVRLDADAAQERVSDDLQIASVDDRVYVVWTDVSTVMGGGADIRFSRSPDNGMSWSAERVIDDPAIALSDSSSATIAVNPRTAAADDDRILVAWRDTREGTQIYAASSSDSGVSFDDAVRVSQEGDGPVNGVCSEPHGAFVGEDAFVVAYVNDPGGADPNRRVRAAATIDGGGTWLLDDPTLDSGGGEAVSPSVARINGGGLSLGAVVSWVDFRSASGVNGDIYRARTGR